MLIMAEVRTDMCKEHPGKEIERLIQADGKTILQKALPENPVKSLQPAPKVPLIAAKMPDTDRDCSMIITFTS